MFICKVLSFPTSGAVTIIATVDETPRELHALCGAVQFNSKQPRVETGIYAIAMTATGSSIISKVCETSADVMQELKEIARVFPRAVFSSAGFSFNATDPSKANPEAKKRRDLAMGIVSADAANANQEALQKAAASASIKRLFSAIAEETDTEKKAAKKSRYASLVESFNEDFVENMPNAFL